MLIAGWHLDLVEEQAGKQQGRPGPEYLGCEVGADRGSDLCSCGAARLSFGAGIPEPKRAEDVCGKTQVPLKEGGGGLEDNEQLVKHCPSQEQREEMFVCFFF